MEKLDLKKEYKAYYSAYKVPTLIEAPAIKCLSVVGQGDPKDEEFFNKVGALYSLAYGIKKVCKLRRKDFTVAPMGGLWWVDGGRPVTQVSPNEWKWKLIIHLPDYVTQEIMNAARKEASKKDMTNLQKEVVFETFDEGKCIQLLHVGPYSAEEPTIEKIFTKMEKERLMPNGNHHEIYLSDPSRIQQEKLKTIIRYPVRKMAS